MLVKAGGHVDIDAKLVALEALFECVFRFHRYRFIHCAASDRVDDCVLVAHEKNCDVDLVLRLSRVRECVFEGKLFERPLLRPAEPSIWKVVNFFRGSEAILK